MVTRRHRFELDRTDLTWQKYCGFLDLSLEEFKDIQRELLMEQLALVHNGPLGRRLLRGGSPKNVAEFRKMARLTKYGDYLPELAIAPHEEMPPRINTAHVET